MATGGRARSPLSPLPLFAPHFSIPCAPRPTAHAHPPARPPPRAPQRVRAHTLRAHSPGAWVGEAEGAAAGAPPPSPGPWLAGRGKKKNGAPCFSRSPRKRVPPPLARPPPMPRPFRPAGSLPTLALGPDGRGEASRGRVPRWATPPPWVGRLGACPVNCKNAMRGPACWGGGRARPTGRATPARPPGCASPTRRQTLCPDQRPRRGGAGPWSGAGHAAMGGGRRASKGGGELARRPTKKNAHAGGESTSVGLARLPGPGRPLGSGGRLDPGRGMAGRRRRACGVLQPGAGGRIL